MKRVVFIAICMVGLGCFTSCGSTAPCGLSQNQKQIKQNQKQMILVVDATLK